MSAPSGKQADIRYGGRDSVTGGGERDDWRTPPTLMADIYDRFKLDFDPCPYPRPKGWDGLKGDWHGRAFVNPPYGKETGAWIQKALGELIAGRIEIAVFLIHARTDTRWFQDLVLEQAEELYFIRGRVAFVGPDGRGEPSPFPSLIAVLKPYVPTGFPKARSWVTRDPAQTKLEADACG